MQQSLVARVIGQIRAVEGVLEGDGSIVMHLKKPNCRPVDVNPVPTNQLLNKQQESHDADTKIHSLYFAHTLLQPTYCFFQPLLANVRGGYTGTL